MSDRQIVRPGSVSAPVIESDGPVFVPTLPAPAAPKTRAEAKPVEPPKETEEKKAADNRDEELLKKKTSAERWQDALKAAKLDENEALRIIDQVLQKGYWEREYKLWGGRLKITLRSRDTAHRVRLRNALDNLLDKSDFSVSNAVCRCNLAASLSLYQGTALPFAKNDDGRPSSRDEIEAAFIQRNEFVGRLADPVYEQLVQACAHFDTWTSAAFAEGAAQGF